MQQTFLLKYPLVQTEDAKPYGGIISPSNGILDIGEKGVTDTTGPKTSF
jgi:hypothetical protein